MPLVSVVMPAYNAEEYISQAFDSLIAQTVDDWECVVVNDGSTDNTLKIIEQYAEKDSRIKYTSISNSGAAKIPRDTAVNLSQSDWILALDADDYLAPETLSKLVERQRQTGADMVMLTLRLTDEQGLPKGDWRIPAADFDYTQVVSGLDAMVLTIGWWTINGNGLIAKRIWLARQPIKNYMNADEYDTRQMYAAASKVAFVDVPYYYRSHGASITRVFSIKHFDTLYVNRLLLDLVQQHFDERSAVIRTMRRQWLGDLLAKRAMLFRHKKTIDVQTYRSLEQFIETSYRQTPHKGTAYNSLPKKVLVASGYPLFLFTAFLMAKRNER